MTTYVRITCTKQTPYGNPPCRARIYEVGASYGAFSYDFALSVAEVRNLIDRGTFVYTKGETSGKIARVEYYWCGICRRYHLRSAADAVTDNNLDSLPYCPMKKAV